jgi:hypothetical protein
VEKRLRDQGDSAAERALADRLDAAGRHFDAVNALARAARRGDAIAKGRVGARILLGDRAPALPARGVSLIEGAALEGSAEAALHAATLAGVGAFRRQSWSDALAFLARAAALGADTAQGALRTLAAGSAPAEASEGAQSEDFWRRVAQRIDVGALLAPPAGRTLAAEPLVRAFARFASPAICAWLVDRARGRLVRAKVYDGIAQRDVANETRTNTAASFGLLETDLVQLLVQARMAAATGIPFAHMEPPTVLHYDTGEQITEHYDFVDPGIPSYAQQIARDGQRVVTFLIYLNDDYEGGETEFPRLGFAHKGTAGEGLFFTNAHASGAADLRSLHAGRPPSRGEKWIVSQFIRNRPVVPGAGTRT